VRGEKLRRDDERYRVQELFHFGRELKAGGGEFYDLGIVRDRKTISMKIAQVVQQIEASFLRRARGCEHNNWKTPFDDSEWTMEKVG
jgi:hypothetical protein